MPAECYLLGFPSQQGKRLRAFLGFPCRVGAQGPDPARGLSVGVLG